MTGRPDPVVVTTAAGVRLTMAAGTDVGRRYRANFDVLHVSADPPLAAVADGMGDGEGSAVAGRTAMATFVAALSGAPAAPAAHGVPAGPGTTGNRQPTEGPGTAGSPGTAGDRLNAEGPGVAGGRLNGEGPGGVRPTPAGLRAAVARVQRAVRVEGERLAAAGPVAGRGSTLTGCTLSALLIDGHEAWVVQLGDSRVYRWRDGLLELLTTDHTMAWLTMAHEWCDAEPRTIAVGRYQLVRYAGHPRMPEPDVLNVALRTGDVFCVCTDGVADQVRYGRLGSVLDPRVPPERAVAAVLADAREAGGSDNATLAVVRVDAVG